MGNIDQLPGTLANGFPIKISYPIFSNNIMNMVAAGNNTRALFDHGHNA